jgi:hypothetical protein
LAFGVGYLGDPGGTRLDFTPGNTFGADLVQNFRHTFPVEGLWLGLSAMIPMSEQMTLMATGSWLFPSNGRSDEEYVFPFGDDGSRTWRSSIQWYTLGIGGAFSIEGPVAVLAGFRYDSFEAGFSDPENVFGIASLPSDEADFRVSLYMPYVGLMAGLGSTVRVGFIGFPYLPGDVRYGQTVGAADPSTSRAEASGAVSNGYFMEIFAEYGINLMGANIGVFGKWEYLRASASLDIDAAFIGLGALTVNDTVDVGFYRQCWTIGGKFALDFVSPL